MKEKNEIHKFWMSKAIEEAKKAMKEGELPIAAVLVSGDGVELAKGQTQTNRRKSMAAHGELFTLLEAKSKIFSSKHPLTIYTTLEPCLMCIGAAMQCQVDRIIYAMPAGPDGGERFLECINEKGLKPPEIRGGVMFEESLKLMKKFVAENPQHFGIHYAKALVEWVEKRI